MYVTVVANRLIVADRKIFLHGDQRIGHGCPKRQDRAGAVPAAVRRIPPPWSGLECQRPIRLAHHARSTRMPNLLEQAIDCDGDHAPRSFRVCSAFSLTR